jgi:hypothetical protein
MQKQYRYAIVKSRKMGLIQRKTIEFKINGSCKDVRSADKLSNELLIIEDMYPYFWEKSVICGNAGGVSFGKRC